MTDKAPPELTLRAVILAAGSADVFSLPGALHFGGWLGLVFLVVIGIVLYRTAVNQPGIP